VFDILSDENSTYLDRVSPFDPGASALPREAELTRRAMLNENSVAMVFRRERIVRMRDLSEVAAQLNIRECYLQAIENGSFEDLPSATYAVGFVRAYADLLGLDSTTIVERFKGEVEELEESQPSSSPARRQQFWIPSVAILLVSLLLAAWIYSG